MILWQPRKHLGGVKGTRLCLGCYFNFTMRR